MTNAQNKLRVLALHGYAQSDSIFKSKLGSLRKGFKRKVEFTFISAPHHVSMKDNFGDEVPETGENVYGWWFSTSNRIFHIIKSDTLVGFEESLDSIARVFKDDGPFDGILGFSQGASFASILCSMQQENLLPFKFDFAIFISGFKSLCSPHNKYYSAILDIPSLHIYGTNDKIIPTEMAIDLGNLFNKKKAIVHDGGHYVPSSKKFYDEFLDDMLMKKTAKNHSVLTLP